MKSMLQAAPLAIGQSNGIFGHQRKILRMTRPESAAAVARLPDPRMSDDPDLQFIGEIIDDAAIDQRASRRQLWTWFYEAVRAGAVHCTAAGRVSRVAFDRLLAERLRPPVIPDGRRGRGQPARARVLAVLAELGKKRAEGMTPKEIGGLADASASSVRRVLGKKK